MPPHHLVRLSGIVYDCSCHELGLGTTHTYMYMWLLPFAEQAMGWLPLRLGLIAEDKPTEFFNISCVHAPTPTTIYWSVDHDIACMPPPPHMYTHATAGIDNLVGGQEETHH